MARNIFEFSEFKFDSATGTLTRKNREARLPEQSARLLQVLLERPNALVSREDLEQVLWPDEKFVNHDQGINVAVNRLRHILRDKPNKPQFLKTIPKRGYLFCGEVTVVTIETPAVSPLEDVWAETQAPARIDRTVDDVDATPGVSVAAAERRRAGWWPTLGVGVLAACGFALFIYFKSHHKPKAAPHVLRVGIAPLRVDGDQQARDAAESFRLELSDAMARLPGVQVPAAGAFVAANAVDIPRISRELNLDDLLLGSISKQGDQYDLRFELVRTADATHLGSFEYGGLRQDLPGISERLQQDVFHYMQFSGAALQSTKGSTNNSQAYDLYLQGEYHMLERNPEALNTSLAVFKQATDLDSNFAAAYAGAATAYLKLSSYDTNPKDGLLSKAESAAQLAVKLDPMLAQAHAVLGATAYKQDRDFTRGEAELREAIRLDPTQAEYRNWLSVLLVEEGRFDEASDQLTLAQNHAPFWPSVYAMEGLVGVYARRDAVAIKAAKHYVDLLPNLPIAHNTMAWVDFETKHYEDAIKEWRQMALLQKNFERVELEDRGLDVFRSKGIRGYAELRLDAIREKRGLGQANDFSPAEWSACAGKESQAMDELDRLAALNDPYMLHVGVDPLYDALHQNPRFLSILAKSGVMIPPSLRSVNSHLCE